MANLARVSDISLPMSRVIKGLPHPVHVREATWADYHDILDIDASVGAYDAGDYLYGKLAIYLKDPDSVCCVGIYQGKVIAFAMCRFPDRGRSIIPRMARVDRTFRNWGLWEFVRSALALYAFTIYPDATAFYSCNSVFKRAPIYKSNYDIRMIREYVVVEVKNRHLHASHRILDIPKRIKIENLTTSGLYDVFSDRKSAWRLFPHGYIIIGRDPIRIHQCNYHMITSECKGIVASRDVTSGEILTLSFGTGFHCPQGYVYEVDIYTATGHAPELVQHVLHHIQIAEKHMTCEETLKLTVFVSQKHGVGGLVEALQGPGYEGRFVMGQISNHYMGVSSVNDDYLGACYRGIGKSKL